MPFFDRIKFIPSDSTKFYELIIIFLNDTNSLNVANNSRRIKSR